MNRSRSQLARSNAIRIAQLYTARDMAWFRGRLILYWTLCEMIEKRKVR